MTLKTVLPSVKFVDGGYVTRCVTSRTSHGTIYLFFDCLSTDFGLLRLTLISS